MCRYPVGEGAKRTRMSGIGVMEFWGNGVMHFFHKSASPLPQHPLLHKNPSGATACVPIVRKVNLCHWCGWVEQRADTFDHIETNFSDILRPQPFENCTPLKRDWQCGDLAGGQLGIGRIGVVLPDPSLVVACRSTLPRAGVCCVSAADFLQ